MPESELPETLEKMWESYLATRFPGLAPGGIPAKRLRHAFFAGCYAAMMMLTKKFDNAQDAEMAMARVQLELNKWMDDTLAEEAKPKSMILRVN